MILSISSSRKKQIKQITQATLKDMDIKAPAVNPKSIVRQLGQLYNFSDPDEKGFTRYIDGKYKIYINNVEYKDMSTWTYAHEAGHIILKHFIKYNNYLSDEIGCVYIDREANFFAAELLMPEEWVYEYIKQYPPCTPGNLGKLISTFNVSWDSLFNRLHTLHIQKKRDSLDVLAGAQTYDLRPSLPITPKTEYKTCIVCGNNKNKPDAQYCFICGGWHFETDTGKTKPIEYKDSIALDHRGHALVCPVCGNTDVEYGDHCDCCDAYLIQECTEELVRIDIYGDQDFRKGCNNTPPGNARYCEYCGNRTSFFKAGILVHWSKCIEDHIRQTTEEAAATKGSQRNFLYGHVR